MISAGIDAGSRTIKVVLLNADSLEVLATGIRDQGVNQADLAGELLEQMLREQGAGRAEIGAMIATGYGRRLIGSADASITEITCQAWGVRHSVPGARTIIDIGGQDSKIIRLGSDGAVEDFIMNDRCAAGSGRFLEVLAARLGVELRQLGELAGLSRAAAMISSMCVVFAETEIVGLLATGTPAADIASGVHASLATRIAAMAGTDTPAPIIFTGGVALIPGMDAALSDAFGKPLTIAPRPQLTCALGAAVLAARRFKGLGTPALRG